MPSRASTVTPSRPGRTTISIPARVAGVERLVDATHPYAGLISVNAVAAAQASGVPLVRYMRPAWDEPADAAWLHVPTIEAAAAGKRYSASAAAGGVGDAVLEITLVIPE